jgi:DNA polymerase-3 subunit delta'
VGKFTTARAIAAVALCERQNACGQCRQCRLLAHGAHPDLRTIEAPPDRRSIPIKDLHELLQGLALRPLEAARKVYILRGAEDLAEDGANALLKSLEEPPPRVTFLLTAPSADVLLPTITSRCQLIALHRVAIEEIARHLMGTHHLEEAEAWRIARASDGLPGWAITAVNHPEIIDARRERLDILLGALSAPNLERLRIADALADRWSAHSDEVRATLEDWAEYWRDAALVRVGLTERTRHADLALHVVETAASCDAATIRKTAASTWRLLDALNHNAHPRLAIETYTLGLPRPGLPTRD